MSDWPRAVLFDFDGVLVNSEPLHFQAFRDVLKTEHIELSEQEYYDNLLGFDDRGAIKHLFEMRGREAEPKTVLRLLTRKSEMMMEHIRRERYMALPGAEAFVRALWRHYPLAICSGGLREEIEAMLEGVSLRDCFPTIIAAEDVAVGKPDPSGYLLTAQRVSEKIAAAGAGSKPLKPADCLIVEDAPTVIRSVRKVGFPVLAVATSHMVEQLGDANWAVRSLEPSEVIEQIPSLRSVLQ